jgi:hypothetical protein
MLEISEERLDKIRAEVNELCKNTYHFATELVVEAGLVVTRVRKDIYIRSKTNSNQPSLPA